MLCANKVLCHCTEEPRISGIATTDCVFCNVIGGWKILCGKQSTLMKPKKSVEHYQTLSSQVGSGHEITQTNSFSHTKLAQNS